MFHVTNLHALCAGSEWFAVLLGAGCLRRELQLGVSEERINVRLFGSLLPKCRLPFRTNLHGRRVQRRWRLV